MMVSGTEVKFEYILQSTNDDRKVTVSGRGKVMYSTEISGERAYRIRRTDAAGFGDVVEVLASGVFEV